MPGMEPLSKEAMIEQLRGDGLSDRLAALRGQVTAFELCHSKVLELLRVHASPEMAALLAKMDQRLQETREEMEHVLTAFERHYERMYGEKPPDEASR